VNDILDNVVTTKEEKLNAIRELIKVEGRINEKADQTRTTRHENDMLSDSKLSKNIRPYSLIFILSVFVLFVSIQSFSTLHVDDVYIFMLKDWGELIFTFYFASRGIEKSISIAQNVLKRSKS